MALKRQAKEKKTKKNVYTYMQHINQSCSQIRDSGVCKATKKIFSTQKIPTTITVENKKKT